MPRFPVEKNCVKDNKAVISGPDQKHIVKVLRLRAGDDITLFDRDSMEYYGKISSIGKNELEVEIYASEKVERESPLNITLYQGLAKGDKMDYIVEKATELGVSAVVPLITERVQTHSRDRHKRWEKIAVEASKQCGRTKPTVIENTLDFKTALLSSDSKDMQIILHVNTELPVKNHLKSTLQAPQNIILFIGPEGGFTDNEVLLAKEMGFISLGLGPRVLRTETASVSVLSILQFIYGDL